MKGETPGAPSHLRRTTRLWFKQVLQDYEMEPHHVKLLTLAAEAWDRCAIAQKAIKEHGLTFTDRWGSPKPRPEVAIKKDAEINFSRLLRELALDIEPPKEPGRPPGLSHSSKPKEKR